MDPTEALARARIQSRWLLNRTGSESRTELMDHADDLAEAFDALDRWICKGGFLPLQWEKAQRR